MSEISRKWPVNAALFALTLALLALALRLVLSSIAALSVKVVR